MNKPSANASKPCAAEPLSRRLALLALSSVGLRAFAAPSTTEARKKKRKPKQTVGEKAKQKCLQQVEQCVGFLSTICEDDADCLALAQRCCPVAGTCDVEGFFTCLSTA